MENEISGCIQCPDLKIFIDKYQIWTCPDNLSIFQFKIQDMDTSGFLFWTRPDFKFSMEDLKIWTRPDICSGLQILT